MLHVREVLGWQDLHACLALVASFMRLCMTQSASSAGAASKTSLDTGVVSGQPLCMLFNHTCASAVACISKQALLLAVLSRFAVVSHRTEAELSHLENRQANSERHANKQGFGMSNVNQRNKHTNFMNAYKNVSSAPDNQKVSHLLLHSTLYMLLWQMHTTALCLSTV